jgi:gas vesicle protein
MSDKPNIPKKKSVGKLIAGLVIGGTIGSVMGLAFAPQKGNRTRKVLKEKAEKALGEGKKIVEKIREKKKGK